MVHRDRRRWEGEGRIDGRLGWGCGLDVVVCRRCQVDGRLLGEGKSNGSRKFDKVVRATRVMRILVG